MHINIECNRVGRQLFAHDTKLELIWTAIPAVVMAFWLPMVLLFGTIPCPIWDRMINFWK